MKKKIIIGLILTLAIGMIGCEDRKETSSNDNNLNQEDASSGINNENDDKEHIDEENNDDEGKSLPNKSNEEMCELYKENVEGYKEILLSLGVPESEFEYVTEEAAKEYNIDFSEISYSDGSIEDDAKYSSSLYGVVFDDDSNIEYITTRLVMRVNEEEIKAGNFKFEETPFYEFSKLMFNEERDYIELNKLIMDEYNGINEKDNIIHILGDYEVEEIYCEGSKIFYTISIDSKEVDKNNALYDN